MKGKLSITLLLGILCSISVFAQKFDVQGVITDPSNISIPGAAVIINGDESSGVITDLDGRFVIKANVGDVLTISCIGYTDAEYTVKSSDRHITIVLKEAFEALDELVVVGYGVQKKSVMTSAVSRVTGETLDEGHPTNVQNALKGKVSGVQIISNSGQPGADSKILIRGVSTTGNSDPLYIIDGVTSEVGINHLNPSDIASIEVLKDAASAAIYGARGANGVVLVTTKDGVKGQQSINYEFTYGIQNPAHMADLCNSEEYQMLLNEQAVNSGLEAYFPTKLTTDTDWQAVLQRKNAPVVNHRLSASGGDERSNYFVSFGYVNQKGVFASEYSGYERYNIRAKYNNTILEAKDRKFLNKITLGVNANYSRASINGTDINNDEGGGIVASMNMLPPTEPVYQTDPDILAKYDIEYPNRILATDGQSYNIIEMREICNPLAELSARHNQIRVPVHFGINATVNADLLPGLSFKTTMSVSNGVTTDRRITPVYDLNATNKNIISEVVDSKSDSRYYQWDNVLTYSKTFGKHSIGAMAGTSISSYTASWITGTDYDISFSSLDKAFIDSATAAEESSKVSSSAYDHRIASVFARVNYNYDEKYLLEAVVRRDGSSNFSNKNKYAVFPSFSAGWVLTKEDFMSGAKGWLNFAKLRASWGQNGNENIGAFQYTTTMSKGSAVVDGKVYTSMLPGGYANADLKWETSEQLDLGIDLRFFNNALTFTADWFDKRTKDMLMSKGLPMYTSYWSMTVNGGTVKNTGVEFDASYHFNIADANFTVSANASHVKNTVVDQGNDDVAYLNTLGGGMGNHISYSQNGMPYGFFYGYKAIGVFQNQAQIDATPHLEGTVPGDIIYEDHDGNGVIDINDMTMIGDPNPDWIFGFNLSAQWKDFDLSAFFQGSTGNDIYKIYRRPNVTLGNYGKEWLGRWHGEGTSNKYPRLQAGAPYQVSSLYVEDGSYLRFKVLQLGYSIPSHILGNAGISKLRVFVQGENLLTFTEYSGYDPEIGTRFGLDAGTYPQARTLIIGANINF